MSDIRELDRLVGAAAAADGAQQVPAGDEGLGMLRAEHPGAPADDIGEDRFGLGVAAGLGERTAEQPEHVECLGVVDPVADHPCPHGQLELFDRRSGSAVRDHGSGQAGAKVDGLVVGRSRRECRVQLDAKCVGVAAVHRVSRVSAAPCSARIRRACAYLSARRARTSGGRSAARSGSALSRLSASLTQRPIGFDAARRTMSK